MTNTKRLLVMLACLMICATLQAQKKELLISYNQQVKMFNPMTQDSSYFGSIIEVLTKEKEIFTRRVMHMNGYKYINGMKIPQNDTLYTYQVKINLAKAELLQSIFNKELLLKEPLNLFEWKLSGETKRILGYLCNKATCSFRGRSYEAYFTRDIPFKAAPWKFHGLPGVVLEVYSSDDYCRWMAQSIKIAPFKTKIDFEWHKTETIELAEYIKWRKVQKQRAKEFLEKGRLQFGDQVYYQSAEPPIEIFDLD
ncbi:GLPGLI family protein [Marinifilum sp.]|uniref:GLPGLI family protein n=1 Tax=Marinifilum sp. TaxID=2033137 RepID=UPI003BA8BEA6